MGIGGRRGMIRRLQMWRFGTTSLSSAERTPSSIATAFRVARSKATPTASAAATAAPLPPSKSQWVQVVVLLPTAFKPLWTVSRSPARTGRRYTSLYSSAALPIRSEDRRSTRAPLAGALGTPSHTRDDAVRAHEAVVVAVAGPDRALVDLGQAELFRAPRRQRLARRASSARTGGRCRRPTAGRTAAS